MPRSPQARQLTSWSAVLAGLVVTVLTSGVIVLWALDRDGRVPILTDLGNPPPEAATGLLLAGLGLVSPRDSTPARS